jgi:hypothetical protein
MSSNRILFAGMHESGKTTFIAALWDYINSDKNDKTITLNSLANSENQYLEKIRSEWLQCKKVSRTNLNDSETVRMNATNQSNGENLILEIPDISGELFNSHFQLREWDTDFDSIVNQMGGILLFINPKDKRNRTQYISDAIPIESEIASDITENKETQKDNTGEKTLETKTDIDFIKWSEEHTSNQVKLVETLQLIAARKEIQSPLRVSVVVSRWDLIEENGGGTPANWLKLKMPLIHQYLACNQHLFNAQVFGVSAQGGDYGNTDERNRLLSIEPFARPQVKLDSTFINDITVPIIWLTQN